MNSTTYSEFEDWLPRPAALRLAFALWVSRPSALAVGVGAAPCAARRPHLLPRSRHRASRRKAIPVDSTASASVVVLPEDVVVGHRRLEQASRPPAEGLGLPPHNGF